MAVVKLRSVPILSFKTNMISQSRRKHQIQHIFDRNSSGDFGSLLGDRTHLYIESEESEERTARETGQTGTRQPALHLAEMVEGRSSQAIVNKQLQNREKQDHRSVRDSESNP